MSVDQAVLILVVGSALWSLAIWCYRKMPYSRKWLYFIVGMTNLLTFLFSADGWLWAIGFGFITTPICMLAISHRLATDLFRG